MFSSVDLLTDMRFLAGRPEHDAALTTPQGYRLLTLAQRTVQMTVAALFPRFLMGAPEAMVTHDNGMTFEVATPDEDGLSVTPIGHAEVYLRSTGGEAYGSTWGGGLGDFVFEGSRIRRPNGRARAVTNGPFIRYVRPSGVLDDTHQPALPSILRPLITYRALVLWANRGGGRDPRPYEEMYANEWGGYGGNGGVLAAISTQYRRSADAAMEGILWWRAWASIAIVGLGNDLINASSGSGGGGFAYSDGNVYSDGTVV